MAYSLFDIAGPIMVGPSSSHTAGACKIGQLAQAIFDATPKKVTFQLHGSFATVTQGHATDRALLGGIMKFKTSDARIKEAHEIARKKGIFYKFQKVDLGAKYHPNTVRIILEKDDHKMSITGSSIGGGIVQICEINDHKVDIHAVAGKYKSLIISHKTDQNPLESVIQRLADQNIRVKEIQSRQLNGHTLSIINFDSHDLRLKTVLEIEQIPGVEFARSLTRLEHE